MAPPNPAPTPTRVRAASRPLTAAGRHLELLATTWAALRRAAERAHLSPTSAALAGRVLRKRPPAPSRIPPRRGVMSDVCVTSEAPALGAAAAVHLLGRCRQRWTTRWVRRQRPSPCGAAEPGCGSGLELVPRSSALLLPGLRRAGRRAESRLDACRSHHRLSPGRRRRSGAATQPAAALRNCPHPIPLSGPFYSGRVLSRTWSSYSCVDRFVFV